MLMLIAVGIPFHQIEECCIFYSVVKSKKPSSRWISFSQIFSIKQEMDRSNLAYDHGRPLSFQTVPVAKVSV